MTKTKRIQEERFLKLRRVAVDVKSELLDQQIRIVYKQVEDLQ